MSPRSLCSLTLGLKEQLNTDSDKNHVENFNNATAWVPPNQLAVWRKSQSGFLLLFCYLLLAFKTGFLSVGTPAVLELAL